MDQEVGGHQILNLLAHSSWTPGLKTEINVCFYKLPVYYAVLQQPVIAGWITAEWTKAAILFCVALGSLRRSGVSASTGAQGWKWRERRVACGGKLTLPAGGAVSSPPGDRRAQGSIQCDPCWCLTESEVSGGNLIIQ